MAPTQFKIRNWAKFQHYKDRNPPWIKLHVEILSSEDWVTLDDASKLLSIACMIIASKNDGLVPDSPSYIQRVAYLNRKPNLKPLIDCGFLEIAQADDIESKQKISKARPETETETETEQSQKEETLLRSVIPKPRKRVRCQLPENFPAQPDFEWSNDLWLKHGRADLCAAAEDEAAKFRDHHSGKLTASADWPASWRTWARNAIKFSNGGRNVRQATAHENFAAGALAAAMENGS